MMLELSYLLTLDYCRAQSSAADWRKLRHASIALDADTLTAEQQQLVEEAGLTLPWVLAWYNPIGQVKRGAVTGEIGIALHEADHELSEAEVWAIIEQMAVDRQGLLREVEVE